MIRWIKTYEKGASYVDILIAVTILLFVISSLIPLFVFGADTIRNNSLKTIAKEIAGEEMEKIKSLSYDDIGTPGGNPEGILEPIKSEERNNHQFQVETRVSWVDDPSDGTLPQDPDPRDYKKVTLIVRWATASGNSSYTLTTLLAREAHEPIYPGGHIVATVKNYPDNSPQENVRVDLISGPSAPRYDYTNQEGEVIFPLVEAGTYEVGIIPPHGYVSIPETQETTVGVGEAKYVDFYIARPGSLTVRLVDPFNNLINKHSRLTISHSLGTQITTQGPDGEFLFENLFPGVWVVEEARASSYEPTSGPTAEVTSGESVTLKIVLIPQPSANIHLTAYDALTQEPLADATVTLTNIETSETITGLTNTQGIYEDSMDAGTYQLIVSKDGYETYTDTIDLPPSQNTIVDAYLNPEVQVGAIRVRTERWWNHRPRNNVPIRVIGPNGYDQVQQTGDYAPGETLFSNLEPGRYHVYRRWRRWWINHRVVQVNVGETAYVLYRY
jgi:hypothetical protein